MEYSPSQQDMLDFDRRGALFQLSAGLQGAWGGIVPHQQIF